MKALRTCNWSCNGTKYELVEGENVSIKKSDEAQAKASGLFDLTIVEKVKKTVSRKKAD